MVLPASAFKRMENFPPILGVIYTTRQVGETGHYSPSNAPAKTKSGTRGRVVARLSDDINQTIVPIGKVDDALERSLSCPDDLPDSTKSQHDFECNDFLSSAARPE